MQAAQIIAESPEPLKALAHLSQNFPMYTTALSRRVIVNESIITELHDNSLKAQGGVNMFWLNGAAIELKDTQPLSLLRLLKKERTTISSLTALGLERSQAFDLLTHPEVSESQKGGAVLDGLFDASDRVEEGDVVVWWNDMEKDSRWVVQCSVFWWVTLIRLIIGMHTGILRYLWCVSLVWNFVNDRLIPSFPAIAAHVSWTVPQRQSKLVQRYLSA
jgi:hypothetical protein